MALKHKTDEVKYCIAQQFSRASRQYFQLARIQNDIAEFTRSMMPSNEGLILDIGCASGEQTRKLGKRVVGIDLALGMLEQAVTVSEKPQADRCWINADTDSLPFASESFEQVYSSMALQWSKHPSLCLSEICRVLKKGGKANLLFPIDGAFWQIKQAYALSGLTPKLHPLRTENDWKQAAENCDFANVSSAIHCFTDSRTHFIDLIRTISKVGASASSVTNGKEQARLTKSRLNTLADHYPKNNGAFCLDYLCMLLQLTK